MLLTATQILSQSWDFYKRDWRKLVPYMALVFLPAFIFGLLTVISLYLNMFFSIPSSAMGIILLMIFAANLVLSIWTSIAITRGVKALLEQKTPSHWEQIFFSSSHLIWPVFLLSVLLFLIVAGGTILLIVPGIIFTVWYAFSFYALVLDGKKVTEAFKFSKQLVTGRWWTIFWRLFFPALTIYLVMVVAQWVILLPVSFLPISQLASAATQGFVVTIINVLVAPMFSAIFIVLYLNAKANPVSAPPQV